MAAAKALAYLRAGRPQAAVDLLASLLSSQPEDADCWFLLGASRHALHELPAAADAFAQSVRLDPGNAEAHIAHITVLRAMGRSDSALEVSHKAVERFPNDARVLYAIALCLEDMADDDAALTYYDATLRTAPAFADAFHNRTLLLVRQYRLQEAERNQRAYVATHPKDYRAHIGLADICLALGRFDDALIAVDALEQLRPHDVDGLLRRGAALASLRRFDESRACFAGARAIDGNKVAEFVQRIAPGSRLEFMLSPENLFFWQCQLAFQRCDWTSWKACTEELKQLSPDIRVEPAVAFISFHLPLCGRERLAVAKHIAKEIEAGAPAYPPPPTLRKARIRIGILSPDFREHLNAYLLLPFFQLLDRECFELYAYSLFPDDNSDVRLKLAAAADVFRDVHGRSDDEAAAQMRTDAIDILIDAAGHTMGGRFGITARRPARIQVAYLGFAGSIGSPRVDFAISDVVVWGEQAEWVESPAYLPDTYFLYDFRSPAPDMPVSRRDYGLPETSFVFCAFHKAEKISPDAFELWLSVLSRVPNAVLWLLALPRTAQENLRRKATDLGIAPSRLYFAPFDSRERYLARQCLGDLMLDTIHHSAMTTACDAMAAGLPVLTLSGNAMASRAGESLARAAGVPELVAANPAHYAEMAVRLASDAAELARLREVLLSRREPLFDTAGRVRELEEVLRDLLQRR